MNFYVNIQSLLDWKILRTHIWQKETKDINGITHLIIINNIIFLLQSITSSIGKASASSAGASSGTSSSKTFVHEKPVEVVSIYSCSFRFYIYSFYLFIKFFFSSLVWMRRKRMGQVERNFCQIHDRHELNTVTKLTFLFFFLFFSVFISISVN